MSLGQFAGVVGTLLLLVPGRAQDGESLRQEVTRYAQSRAMKATGFLLTAEEGAARLRDAPAIVDLRPEQDYAAGRLKGSQRLSQRDLFAPGVLERLPANGPILIVDNGSSEAVEVMVLLRLLGRQAFAVKGGVEMVRRAAANAEAVVGRKKGSGPVDENASEKEPERSTRAGGSGSGPAVPPTVPPWIWAAVGGPLLIVAGLAWWFAWWQPRQKAKPLFDAVKLLSGGGEAALAQAESLLIQALEAGLKPGQRKEARFLLAYVKARLGNGAEALLVLKDADDSTLETAYLKLWIAVKEKRWEEAERVCFDHGAKLADYLDGKNLIGICYLELAHGAISRNDFERALACFKRVKDLGVHGEHVPAHLNDLEMVLAMNALFEGKDKASLAKERFETARGSAEASGRSSLLARIGLLLCEWRSEDYPDIDERLGAILEEVKAGAADSETGGLVPDMSLWYAVSLLYQWMRLPAKSGLSGEDLEFLHHRLNGVETSGKKAGDAHLVDGLIDYYCANSDNARREGVNALRKAIEAGVTLPEVLYLVQCEDRLAEMAGRRTDTYLQLLRGFLADPGVAVDLRRELFEHLRQFERFRKLGDITPPDDTGASPSLRDITASCELIEERVQRIFTGYHDQEKRKDVQELLGGLKRSRSDIDRSIEELGRTEQKLMRVAGESLLPEEARAEKEPA